MGAALVKGNRETGSEIPPLLFETQIFASWTLKDVKELYRRFQAEVFGFALVEIQFESILSFKPEISQYVAIEDLFRILDNDHDGRLDGLEFLGGLLLCCNATFEEKARFCFEMFDFNLNASLSQKEAVMMILSCICGMNLLTGGHEDMEPDIDIVEKIVADAFQKTDINRDGYLSYEEFVVWARSNRDLMAGLEKLNKLAQDAKKDVESDDSAEEIDESYLSDTEIFGDQPHGDMTLPTSTLSTKQPKIPPSWRSQILEPTNFRVSKHHLDGPRTNLALSWAFGYRCNIARNNVRYIGSSMKHIVYPTATYAIIYEYESKSQSFYEGHASEVTCLAIHPSGNIVATADIDSNIHLWNSSTKACMTLIRGVKSQGIQHLAFSSSGNHIACVGMDQEHTVAIYDTTSGDLISSTKGILYPNNIYDMCYSNNGTEIALAGGKGQLMILTGTHTTKRSIDSYYAKIGSIGKKQTFFSVVYIRDDPLVGCGSGEIYRFKAGHCVEIIQAHNTNDPIYSLSYNKEDDTLTSGGRDAIIKTWDHTLKAIGTPIDVSEAVTGGTPSITNPKNYDIITVQQIDSRVLFGTKGGDIYDLSLSTMMSGKGGVVKITSSHHHGELWGLATHPTKDEFATCGDDKTIRIWSIRSHDIIRQRGMPHSARVVSYNHTGDVIAVGMMDGNVALMEANSMILKVYVTWKHSEDVITCLKFSYDSSFLAVGSQDGIIYLYRSDDRKAYIKHAVCRGHTAAIATIDFSMDSKFIQSNSTDLNLYYWDMRGSQIKVTASLRDTTWSTLTCPYNWGCQGIWTDSVISSNIDVHSCICAPDLRDAVVGYSNGDILLFHYPALSADSLHQRYVGHAGGVSCVRFSYNRRYMISLGKSDRTIILWKHDIEIPEDSCDDVAGNTSSGSESDADVNIICDVVIGSSASTSSSEAIGSSNAALPWKSSVIEPSTALSSSMNASSQSTDVDLTLAWIHGYRCYDTRNNVHYSSSGVVVYHTGTVAIAYSKSNGKQKFLQGYHQQEILSLCGHPAGQLFASGDKGDHPRIIIWDASSMRVINQLSTTHHRGIPLLAFSNRGQHLASIGQDVNSMLIIYNWSKELMILSAPTTKQRLQCMIYMSFNRSLFQSSSSTSPTLFMLPADDVIVTGGQNHLRFQWAQGQNIISQNAIWGQEKKDVIMSLASASSNICISGSIKGVLLIWKNFKAEKNMSVNLAVGESYPHTSPILAIAGIAGKLISCVVDVKRNVFEEYIRDDYMNLCRYVVGDQLGKISIWVTIENAMDGKVDLILVKCFDMTTIMPKSLQPNVRSLAMRDGILLIGSKGGEIYEVAEASIPFIYQQQPSQPIGISAQRLITGHHTAEVWGLASHPTLPIFFTTGDDCTLRCWSLSEHSLLSYVILPEKARAIDIIPSDSSVIAVGFNSGAIWLIKLVKLLNPMNMPATIIDPKLAGQEIILHQASTSTQPNMSSNNTKSRLDLTTTTIFVPEQLIEHEGKFVLPKGPSQWIQELKYSFDGKYLIAGCHDCKAYIYDVVREYKLIATCIGHNGPINHFDYGVLLTPMIIKSSVDEIQYDAKDKDVEVSRTTTVTMLIELYDERNQQITQLQRIQQQTTITRSSSPPIMNVEEKVISSKPLSSNDIIIQSTSDAGELFYWHMDGSRIASAVSVKDAWWHSWTIPYGWPVQGIWPIGADSYNDKSSVIHTACRSHTWRQVPVFAIANESGQVKLYNYPCISPGAPDKCYGGHAAQITNIKFSYNDQYLISIGGLDKSIFVWETDIIDELRELKAVTSLAVASPAMLNIISSSSRNPATTQPDIDESLLSDLLPVKFIASGGDEFTAIKPWKGSIREPSDWVDTEESSRAPDHSLQLSYVYGYRGWDCRNNLYYASSRNHVIYHIAGVGVVLNTETNTQIHNTEHDDDIISIAIHPDGHTIATGEVGKTPKLLIWDANTGTTIRVINYHSRGVGQLAFAGNDGSMIISTGLDDDRTIAIHAIKSGNLIGKGKVGRGVDIYGMATNYVGDSGVFCTAGKNHIKFWTLPTSSTSSAGELSSKTGIYGNNKSITARSATAVIYYAGDAVTGMVDGSIIIWKDRTASKYKAAHTGAITAMCVLSHVDNKDPNPRMITGGKDGFAHIWNVQLDKIWSLDMNTTTPASSCPMIQSIACRENRLLIGTKASEIYEVNMMADANADVHCLMVGHYDDRAEVWGLSTHPNNQRFATCGDDMTVRVWDSKAHLQLHMIHLKAKARGIAYAPDGNQLAVALMDGRIIVLSSDLSTQYYDMMISSTWIEVVQYSPNGMNLAVGAHDGVITIIDTSSFSIRAKCHGHHGAILGFDWSSDSMIIQSCSSDYELLYWDAIQGKQSKSLAVVRDIRWHTSTCLLGWGVQGIWPSGADGSDVNSVDRSHDHKLLVSGDDFKRVKLFRYPCPKDHADYKAYKGHSEHVNRVKFSYDCRYVFSTGGLDKAILQFEVKSISNNKPLSKEW